MNGKNKISLQIQYFDGCANSAEMIRGVMKAIRGMENEIDYQEILIETNEQAEKLKFRGSPTLLINGEDFEEMNEPEEVYINCRIYRNGLPAVEEIRSKIEKYNQRTDKKQ